MHIEQDKSTETVTPFKQDIQMRASVPISERQNDNKSDNTLLKEFEAKLQLIRDRVASVAHEYQTGCYLVGRPGTSKRFTVRQELERLEEPNLYRNARMNAWGSSPCWQIILSM